MSEPQAPVVAVIGEALIDVAADGTMRPGGSPLNVAVGLARLGRPTALLARFGGDEPARLLRTHAAASGVDLRHAVTTAQPSTVARVHLDALGVAHYDFTVEGTADFGWSDAELDVPSSARIVHFGSLASWLPPSDAVIGTRIAALHAAGQVLISYDPNVRPQLQPDATSARTQVESALRHAHVVKASADDLRHLYGGEPAGSIARRWLASGPRLVVVTSGGGGARAFTDTGEVHRPGRRVRVVDTVGAGDAFSSGLLDALLHRSVTTPDALGALPSDALAGVLDAAVLVAAITCTRTGADPPTRAELTAAETRPQQS